MNYTYICKNGHVLTVLARLTEEKQDAYECSRCGEMAFRRYQRNIPIHFNDSGFYVVDKKLDTIKAEGGPTYDQ